MTTLAKSVEYRSAGLGESEPSCSGVSASANRTGMNTAAATTRKAAALKAQRRAERLSDDIEVPAALSFQVVDGNSRRHEKRRGRITAKHAELNPGNASAGHGSAEDAGGDAVRSGRKGMVRLHHHAP